MNTTIGRHKLTMVDGSVWRTDFEPCRAPDDTLGADQLGGFLHVYASGDDDVQVYASFNPAHIVSTIDMDCG